MAETWTPITTADPATETAISRRAALGLVVIGLGLTGCGGNGGKSGAAASAFGWLRPGAAPSGWSVATISIGARLPYPPGWQRIAGDAGTATAALFDKRHHFLGYLNLTPRQSNETLADWARFRLQHNAEENEHAIRRLAVGTGLRFAAGHGTCVRDAYTTTNNTRYIEIACLDVGRSSSVVIIGASPAQAWSRISPILKRAISAVTA
jgi:hypothetical protein